MRRALTKPQRGALRAPRERWRRRWRRSVASTVRRRARSGCSCAGGERCQATVVASSLSGYASLVERLVPEELERLLSRLRSEAGAAAARPRRGRSTTSPGTSWCCSSGSPRRGRTTRSGAARAALELHRGSRALGRSWRRRRGRAAGARTPASTPDGWSRTRRRARGLPASRAARRWSAARLAAGGRPGRGLGQPRVPPPDRPVLRDRAAGADRRCATAGSRWCPTGCSASRGLRDAHRGAGEGRASPPYTGRDAELAGCSRCLADGALGRRAPGDDHRGAGDGEEPAAARVPAGARRGRRRPSSLGRCQLERRRRGLPAVHRGPPLRAGAAGEREGRRRRRSRGVRAISPALEEFIPLYLHLLSIPAPDLPVPRHLQGDAFRLAMQEALAAILTLAAQRRADRGAAGGLALGRRGLQRGAAAGLRRSWPSYPLLVLVTLRPGYGMDLGALGPAPRPSPSGPLEPASTAAILGSRPPRRAPPRRARGADPRAHRPATRSSSRRSARRCWRRAPSAPAAGRRRLAGPAAPAGAAGLDPGGDPRPPGPPRLECARRAAPGLGGRARVHPHPAGAHRHRPRDAPAARSNG